MIELLFVVCMSAAPENCEQRSMVYNGMSPMTCLRAAQPELATWVDTHPKWRIVSWKCRPINGSAQDT